MESQNATLCQGGEHETSFIWAVDAGYSDYAKEIDIPCGDFLHTITIQPRGRVKIFGVALKYPYMGRASFLYRETAPPLVEGSCLVVAFETPKGCGLDLRLLRTGDIRLGLSAGYDKPCKLGDRDKVIIKWGHGRIVE